MLNMSPAARSLTGDRGLIISGEAEVLPSITPGQPQRGSFSLKHPGFIHVLNKVKLTALPSQKKTFSKGVWKEGEQLCFYLLWLPWQLMP